MTAPDVVYGYPRGPKTGPAWQVAWKHLDTGAWISLDELALHMTMTGCSEKSARTVLQRARAAGLIDRRYWVGGDPRRARVEYRRLDIDGGWRVLAEDEEDPL